MTNVIVFLKKRFFGVIFLFLFGLYVYLLYICWCNGVGKTALIQKTTTKMKNKTTYLKLVSLSLGAVVLFFTTILKVETSNLFIVLSDESVKGQNGKVLEGVDDLGGGALVEQGVFGSVQEVVADEFDIPLMGALLLVDFDDLEYTFETLSVVSERVFFFQDLIQTYESVLYRKVKLFLFYSFIKIPSVFL